MAKGDVKIHDLGGRINPVVRRFFTRLGGTAINAGEPVMWTATFGTGANGNYVVPVTDAKPVCETDYFVGIAASDGTHTASANGYVDVYLDLEGIVWKAKAKSSTVFNSQAKIDQSRGYLVAFDLTTSSYTVDTGSQGVNNGLVVVDGDPDSAEVFFIGRQKARWTL